MFAPVQKEPAALSQDTTTLGLFMTHRRALVNYASSIVGCRAQAEEVVHEAWLRFDAASRGRFLDDGFRRSLFFYRNLDEEVTVAGYELSLFYDAGWGFADLNFNDFTELLEAPTQVKMEQAEYTGTLTVGTRWLDERLQLGSSLLKLGMHQI